MWCYMLIYLLDCFFEVNVINCYIIVMYEVSIVVWCFIRCNEMIKYLVGIQVIIIFEEEVDMVLCKKDFSLVVSSRSKLISLFMGFV